MMNRFIRTEILIGADSLTAVKNANIIVFGVGGVGSFVCEALARCGVGKIALVDNDVIAESNINRQIIALSSTVGKPKVQVMADRISDINPDCSVTPLQCFYTPEHEISLSGYDYIIDAIDTVSSKIALIEEANHMNIPIISCMGTGNKLDPTQFEISDIYKTSVCPLARVMRRELKARGIKRLKVLYSKEPAIKPAECKNENSKKRQTPGSISFVPPVAGMIIAGEVINDIIRN
ncbi:MAG: tRNA threonylcarbamoyladenosine dehydratase [Clostridiales bacterium]|nr:tRNA threonylcarbamoyladenosine dehydratase [Clostridiales bacterium]